MKQIRSFLFIPGIRADWVEKADQTGADALILDLEDSVPDSAKDSARDIVSSRIGMLASTGQRVYVRINKSVFLYSMKDLEAVISPGIEGILLPKPDGPRDVDMAHLMISEMELKRGIPIGSVGLIPTLETAKSLQFAYEIATHPRVTGIACASARSGDVQRAVGFKWTREGLESLHFKSAAIIAARAAGKQPIAGLWQDVRDLEGFSHAVALHRQLGFTGELLIHPSHVAQANAAYSPDEEELRYYSRMIEAFEQAEAQGRAAVIYDGEHIDSAHVKTARLILQQADSFAELAVTARPHHTI
ncbi:citrate lyase [Advenella kashmirensis WT001]|uniref:Citrate lyase n=1 Tax=Advenella kashmirensis (strain DSM 17095 / LMG 22695 / WT001) TaxID=1036672 RepID=I3UAZ0_ADVKW|nr:CoA ester lyase [Advenella kashmirensis]AFK62178.1 citrate lyase [Advenella kashmirensis WT001]